VNVIANPNFGTVISESGSSYTWTENAHEFRLTSWNNDPVSDSGGEAFYMRDYETGHFWSPASSNRRRILLYYSVMALVTVSLNILKTAYIQKCWYMLIWKLQLNLP
jgi:cellobiose phosphorylase